MPDTRVESAARQAQSVLGPVAPGDLGIILPHEHLVVDLGVWFAEPDDPALKPRAFEPVGLGNLAWLAYNQYNNLDNMRLLDEAVAVDEATLFRQAGGGTIVDVTTAGLGRDLPALRRISLATGLNVIAGTGFYVMDGAAARRLEGKSEAFLFEEMLAELTVGAGDTGIRAGIIGEIGCSWPLRDGEKKVLRACARAQARTGAAITIHPGRHEDSPLEILRVLDAAGADPGRVIIGHLDRTGFRRATLRRIAKTGCCLEYDIFGGNPFYPLRFGVFDRPCDRERIEQIIGLIGDGYLDRILISQDTCLKTKLVRFGGQGYAHILRNILPQMAARGMTGDQVRTIMVENPRRCLCFLD